MTDKLDGVPVMKVVQYYSDNTGSLLPSPQPDVNTDDATLVALSETADVSVITDYRGDYPDNTCDVLTYTLATTGTTQTITALSGYTWGIVNIARASGTETLKIEQLIDGTNVAGNLTVKGATGTLVGAATLDVGTYQFSLACKALKLTKSASTDTLVITFGLKKVGAPI